MTNYTPTTEKVRDAYVRTMRNAFIASTGEHREEFDRWVDQIKREYAAQMFEEHAVNRYEAYLTDPSLEVSDQPSDLAKHYKSAAENLRLRATEIRKGS